jgi:uncharacterized protein YjbI with pentapeptide repeats
MNQDQQPRPWWKGSQLTWALTVLSVASLVIITILGYLLNWKWTELLWRWLELLIIPVVLATGAFWFNNQTRKSERELALRERENEQELAHKERENDREIAQDRVREEALQRYLDRMQELILDKGLRRSEKDAEIRDVARARTLTVLRSLDGNRKGQVVKFLHEANLIGKGESESQQRYQVILAGKAIQVIEAIIDLRTADLSGADLSNADLNGVNLSNADLREANLSRANLTGANLFSADLSHANLSPTAIGGAELMYANLTGANLRGTDLTRASLRQTNLSGADLTGAYLSRANLRHAKLSRADLSGANLRNVKDWTSEQLAQAGSLVGATLPDGTVMTEEGWEEFKKQYRQ